MHSSGLLFLSNLFSTDMLVIVFFALLLFGGEKLPEIARGLGKGLRDFKDASDGIKREINNQIYNFEEQREEKKIEEANVIKQTEPQKELPEGNTVATETPQGVENTIPVSQSYIHTGESTGIDSPADDHNNVLNGNHSATTHDEASTTNNEIAKNS